MKTFITNVYNALRADSTLSSYLEDVFVLDDAGPPNVDFTYCVTLFPLAEDEELVYVGRSIRTMYTISVACWLKFGGDPSGVFLGDPSLLKTLPEFVSNVKTVLRANTFSNYTLPSTGEVFNMSVKYNVSRGGSTSTLYLARFEYAAQVDSTF